MSKVWLIKHSNCVVSTRNLVSFSLGIRGKGWIHPYSVNAFLKKKYAQKWLDDNNIKHYEIIGIELPKEQTDE